ncbi:MAG TPA: hypothetical protein VKF40_31125 [Burkholderiales bacterium]|nr:hypothetical protein [Burkholderiales bacterium]
MDTGVWVTWYDLAESGRDEYCAWLHGAFMPQLLARPGYRWAAHYATVDKGVRRTNARDTRNNTDDPTVPRGDRFLLLVGADNADVFGNPTPTALQAQQPAQGRKMLALRSGERMNIFVEAGRVEGPEAKDYREGMLLAPCIQVGAYNCPWQDEEEMLAFYSQWRMPAMGRTTGCVRIRKLASVAGWAKHGILYEFISLEARNQHFIGHEDAHPDMKAWGDKVTKRLTHAPGSSTLATRLWPAIQ